MQITVLISKQNNKTNTYLHFIWIELIKYYFTYEQGNDKIIMKTPYCSGKKMNSNKEIAIQCWMLLLKFNVFTEIQATTITKNLIQTDVS